MKLNRSLGLTLVAAALVTVYGCKEEPKQAAAPAAAPAAVLIGMDLPSEIVPQPARGNTKQPKTENNPIASSLIHLPFFRSVRCAAPIAGSYCLAFSAVACSPRSEESSAARQCASAFRQHRCASSAKISPKYSSMCPRDSRSSAMYGPSSAAAAVRRWSKHRRLRGRFRDLMPALGCWRMCRWRWAAADCLWPDVPVSGRPRTVFCVLSLRSCAPGRWW